MKNTKYTESELIEMKLHLIEALLRAKREGTEITNELNMTADKKKILIEKFGFSPVQASCILDLKIPISDLDEELFLSSIKDLKQQQKNTNL